MSKCATCGRELDVPGDAASLDCGGDCWSCVGDMEASMTRRPRIRMPPNTKPDSAHCLFWYDEPRLWYGPLDDGGVGLAMQTDDADRGSVFMVVRVSPRRLRAILANCTTLREAYRFPEDGKRYRLVHESSGWNEMRDWGELNVVDLSSPGARVTRTRPHKYRTRADKYSRTKRRRSS